MLIESLLKVRVDCIHPRDFVRAMASLWFPFLSLSPSKDCAPLRIYVEGYQFQYFKPSFDIHKIVHTIVTCLMLTDTHAEYLVQGAWFATAICTANVGHVVNPLSRNTL